MRATLAVFKETPRSLVFKALFACILGEISKEKYRLISETIRIMSCNTVVTVLKK